MDALALIHRARDAGLRLEVAGNALKITGPKEAEPLVRLLADNKTQVLEVLADSGLQELQELRELVPQSVEEEGRRDLVEERNPGPYASALAALRAKCPDYVPEDRWRQAIADATAFSSKWATQAHAFGWTERELFGLHPVPEQPAANFSRLSRLDDTGLIWLLRGRPVIMLTATEAVMRCRSGATLKFYRRTKPAPAEIDKAAPISKPTPVRIVDAQALVKQRLGDAPKPARRKPDAANHAEATHLIPEDLSIPEFLRREKYDIAGKAVA
jgi:hypothetical protein